MGSITREGLSLEERWEAAGTETLLTGTQALVRLPLIRRQLDAAAGHDTAGFISGYRGSPLGGYDKELWKQRERLKAARVHFEPGLNEDLAATACWGTQQVGLHPGAKQAGVFAIWYGKGPGVDRSGDVLRHANGAGTAPLGGVLALAGDDPASKSSTVTSGSEHAFADLELPMLDPADVAEVLEFGVKAIAMSRHAGTWVGLKCVAETMDATMSLVVDPAAYATVAPGDAGDVHIRLKDAPLAIEQRLRHVKLPAAQAFARMNGLDRVVQDSPQARFGIAVRGKAWSTLKQALADAGISPELARIGGLRIWKVGLAWPLDREGALAFARGLEEVLVVEDRRAFLESQLREAFYDLPNRPRLSGKDVLSDLAELDAAQILRALAARLPAPLQTERLRAREAELDALAKAQQEPVALRAPFFCPGCPHNTSTRVPEGSHALAGIGCHYLAKDMGRDSDLFTQMGGEGTPWIGQQHFTTTPHVFANMGDGTYAHSGSLAIRAALAAKANMTFKVLVNSAVAMTGGQAPDAEVTVPRIAAQVAAEGVARIAIVADDPERHRGDALLPAFATFHHRRELDSVQRELRAVPGVSVLLYDQQCATERRRMRKRGTAAAAVRRAVINPRVCEDCGDCSRASNCIAVEPVETPWGRKRRIDQSACNQDLSCVEGFCPSFVTVEGVEPARPPLPTVAEPPREPTLPEPAPGDTWNILLAGIGGQGTTALAQIIAVAAQMEGRPVRTLDMLGLAQKGGGVYAQLRLGRPGDAVPSPRIGAAQADAVIAADLIGAHGRVARPMLGARTRVMANADLASTGAFVLNPESRNDAGAMLASLRATGAAVTALPAARLVEEGFGDLIFLNVFLLGAAWQAGMLPLGREALRRAITLNGAQVERNLAAFEAGRAARPAEPAAPEAVEAMVARLSADLAAYQSRRYAARFDALLAALRGATADEALLREAARQAYRAMAIKDEYEVARLHADTSWQEGRFTGDVRPTFHLAPPLLGARKREFGPWMATAFRALRHGKALRGTVLDPFGHTAERREERALREEFLATLARFIPLLHPANEALLLAWLREWAGIKGFGHVKAANIAKARPRIAEAGRLFLASAAR